MNGRWRISPVAAAPATESVCHGDNGLGYAPAAGLNPHLGPMNSAFSFRMNRIMRIFFGCCSLMSSGMNSPNLKMGDDARCWAKTSYLTL